MIDLTLFDFPTSPENTMYHVKMSFLSSLINMKEIKIY